MLGDPPSVQKTYRPQRQRGAGPYFVNRLKMRHLELLAALHIHRKLNDAASETSLSQPAASKMLGEIERLVGVQLFTRLPRGIEPTLYGEVLIRRSRAALSELARAGEEVMALREGMAGSISVGAVTGPAVDLLFDAINGLRVSRPNLQITVEVEPSDKLIEDLLTSRLDFAIARLPRHADPALFVCERLEPEEIGLVVRQSHPLAALDRVAVADLADCEWVLQPRGSLLRRSIDQMMLTHGLPVPTRVISTTSTLMSLAVATKSDAIAPLALSLADIFLPSQKLQRLKLDARIEVEPFGLVRLKSHILAPAAEALYGMLKTATVRFDGVSEVIA